MCKHDRSCWLKIIVENKPRSWCFTRKHNMRRQGLLGFLSFFQHDHMGLLLISGHSFSLSRSHSWGDFAIQGLIKTPPWPFLHPPGRPFLRLHFLQSDAVLDEGSGHLAPSLCIVYAQSHLPQFMLFNLEFSWVQRQDFACWRDL